MWKTYFEAIYGGSYATTKSYALFPFLSKKIPTFDFAIVVAGDDDTTLKDSPASAGRRLMFRPFRNSRKDFVTTRDNVIFELGMCCMALGETRVIIVRHKDVRLIDDLRGLNRDQMKVLDAATNRLCSTMLTSENIQITAFDYETLGDIRAVAPRIREYIISASDRFSPVVIGAACSTASGYIGNFVESLCFALHDARVKAKGPDMISYGGADCTEEEFLRHIDPETVSIHLLLPDTEAVLDEKLLENPKSFLFGNFYRRHGIRNNGRIKDARRPIEFCSREVDGKIMILDVPTTILSSYMTAVKILEIDADEEKREEQQKIRFLIKEIDNFKASLGKLLARDEKRNCFYVRGNYSGESVIYPYRIHIHEISFDESKDGKSCPWLYA